jgi:tetratricopeptide (TPR) repeat protein
VTQPLIFISYSHEDEAEKEQLLDHLGVLQHAGLIDLWSDDRIGAGAEWEVEISQAVAQAKVAILLITANFLTSDFILGRELPALLQRREAEGLVILPVIAKACAWQRVEWLAPIIQADPKRIKPIWRGPNSRVDEELAVIAEQVARIVQGEQPDLATALASLEQPTNQNRTITLNDQASAEIIFGDKKNVIEIGTLVLPTGPVAVVALALLGVLALAFYLIFPPTPPDAAQNSLFNVVVAEIGQVDAAGSLRPSADGEQISERIYEGLRLEFESLPVELRQDFQPAIWHDRLHPLAGGQKIGFIADPKSAADLAARVKADVIIYGALEVNDNSASFTPQFYVPPLRGEAEEITGEQKLGGPIPIQTLSGQDHQAALALNKKLVNRNKILARFTVGLMYDLNGFHQDAVEVFEPALAELDWDENSGQEIFYYFLGRSALFLKRYAEAEAAFQQAFEVSGHTYARAYIGLGGVYLGQAQQPGLEAAQKESYVQQAVETYQKAVAESPEAYLHVARLALGMAYRLQGETLLRSGKEDQAIALFDQAVEEIQAALPPLQTAGQHRYLGQAYQSLGAAYGLQGYIRQKRGDKAGSSALYEKAVEAYSDCIAQREQASHDETLSQRIIPGCEQDKKTFEEALTQLH